MANDTINQIVNHVLNQKNPFEVRGPAGSGKTYTLVHVIQRLEKVKMNGVVLSLTNVAVGEINNRFDENFVSRAMTSHVFAWIWLKRFYRHLLLDKTIQWPQNSEWKRLIEHGVKELVFFEDFFSQTSNSQTNDDFTEVLNPNLLLKLFGEAVRYSEKFSEKISSVIDFLFIDEYQDTDKLFVQSIVSAISDQVVIGFFGDPLQKIYPTNGVGGLESVFEKNKVKNFPLLTNYRSNGKLLSLFNSLRPEGTSFAQVSSDKVDEGGDENGNIFIVKSTEALTHEIFKKIEKAVQIDGTIVTLSPTNVQAFSGDKSIVLIENLRNSLNDTFEESRVTISDLILHPESIMAVNNLLTLIAITRDYFSYYEVRAISQLFKHGDNFWPLEKIKKCKDDLKDGDFAFIDTINVDDRIKIWLKDFLQSLTYEDMGKIYISLIKDRVENSMTIQKVKGLEFENVLVNMDRGTYRSLGLNQITLNPLTYKNTKLANCMFYVSITRAKKNIIIYVNTTKESDFYFKLIKHLKDFSIVFKEMEIK